MNIALILSGGTGTRLGTKVPKQYIEVDGRAVISWCLEAFDGHNEIDAVQIVADEAWHDMIRNLAGSKFRGFSQPGRTRQLSIFNGLKDILEYSEVSDVVIVHDAARPFVSQELISSCIEACGSHDGAMPALTVKDTMYVCNGSRITSLIERDSLRAGQAPEAFILGKYYDANAALFPERILNIKGASEPAVLADMDVVIVPGDENNFKITTSADMERFAQLASTMCKG